MYNRMTNYEECIDLSNITPEVWAILDEVCPPANEFEKQDFDHIRYINERFPDEQSLEHIDVELEKVQSLLLETEGELRAQVHKQAGLSINAVRSMSEAEEMIKAVLHQVDKINELVDDSLERVNEVTREVRQLDTVRRNIDTSLLVVSQLDKLVQTKDTIEKSLCLDQIDMLTRSLSELRVVRNFFEGYIHIPDISEQLKSVDSIEHRCQMYAMKLFKSLFRLETERGNDLRASVLTDNSAAAKEVCQLVEACKARDEAVSWYIDRLIGDYRSKFTLSAEISWIDSVDQRYTWLKKILVDLDQKHLMPTDWDMARKMSEAFCQQTRTDLCSTMRRNRPMITVQLLKYLIERTTCFEIILANKFPISASLEATGSQHPFDFIGSISYGFREFLDIYVESVREDLKGSIDRFAAELRNTVFHTPHLNEGQHIVSSCGDLFVFYRTCIQQMSKLGDNQTMLTLSSAFKHFLNEYNVKVLGQFRLGTDTESKSFASSVYSKASISSRKLLVEADIARLCSIIATADYCTSLIAQLENKLKAKISPNLHGEIQIDYKDVTEGYQSLVNEYLKQLVDDVLTNCEICLNNTMTKTNWSSYDNVGDQSAYVNGVLTHLSRTVPLVRQNLGSSRRHFTEYCHNFVSSFLPKYLDAILKCRNISIAGTEQLLLDAQSLRMELSNLPSIGCTTVRRSPQVLIDCVVKWFSRVESVLKLVMMPHEPLECFLDRCGSLIGKDDKMLRKILDMKGLRRQDQNRLMDRYMRDISSSPKPLNSKSVQEQISSTEQAGADEIVGSEQAIK